MGSTTVNVNPFVNLGVVSYRPKVGRGNGGSYGFTWWYGREGYALQGNFEWEMLNRVFNRLKEFHAGTIEDGALTKRHKFLIALLGLKPQFTECNVLRIRDRDENPMSKRVYYVYAKTIEDGILFNIMLETVLSADDDDERYFSFYYKALQ